MLMGTPRRPLIVDWTWATAGLTTAGNRVIVLRFFSGAIRAMRGPLPTSLRG